MHANPYLAPKSSIKDLAQNQGYADIDIFSSRGRIGRMRYLVYNLIVAIGIGAIVFLGLSILGFDALRVDRFTTPKLVFTVVFLALYVYAVVISIIFAIKRLHDVNLTGWFYLLSLVPLINFFFMLFLFIWPGTPASNNYGRRPMPNSLGVKIVFTICVILMALIFAGMIFIDLPNNVNIFGDDTPSL